MTEPLEVPMLMKFPDGVYRSPLAALDTLEEPVFPEYEDDIPDDDAPAEAAVDDLQGRTP